MTFKIPPEIMALHERINAIQKPLVKELGEKIGFGRMMQLAQECWGEIDGNGGEFVSGPCAVMTVPCGCREGNVKLTAETGHCEWCCGAGWLTKHVKKLQEQEIS